MQTQSDTPLLTATQLEQQSYPQIRTCDGCNGKFTVGSKKAGRGRRFCSDLCKTRWHARQFVRIPHSDYHLLKKLKDRPDLLQQLTA